MTALFVYLVKVNIALIIFCLGYYAVLRHLTFYTLNRVYLVCAILFATLYPLVNFSDLLNRHQEIARPVQLIIVNWQAPVVHAVQVAQQHNKWYWLEMVFWTGVIILAVRFLMQLLSLYKLHRQSKPIQIHQYLVRVISGDINPFSFWKSIYINPENHQPHELKAILAHEQVHVNEWHTLDILLGELSTIFYWFNPGVWLMKRAIRENIEFITDQKILQSGSDPKAYQYSLLNVSFNGGHNAIVNHFNTSTIKKRIIMMNSKRSSPLNLTRYAVLVPAVITLVLVFTISKAELGKQVAKGNAAISKAFNTTINNLTPANVSSAATSAKRKLMVLPNAVSAFFKDDAKPNLQDSLIINAPQKITIPFGLFSKYADTNRYGHNNKEVIVVGYGKQTRDTIQVNSAVEELLKQLPGAYINNDGMLTVNQQMVTTAKINGVTIRSTQNLPAKTVSVGNMNGVSIAPNGNVIVTKPLTTYSQNVGTYYRSDTSEYRNNGQTGAITVRGYGTLNSTQPLIIVDGRQIEGINSINPNIIESVSVLKDPTSTAVYGDKGKYGVVLITTKKPEQNIMGFTYSPKEPLYIVNGAEMNKEDVNKIYGNNIAGVGVYKDGAAAAKYGEKGKDGVIEITTKNRGEDAVTVKGFKITTDPRVINFNTKNIFSGKLLLINGKEATESELNKIPADNIKLIKPLTAKEKAKYGDKAKNGGFAITTIK